jgi:hypothetical protein
MLVIEDSYELIALTKALFEARFHENPDCAEVQGSPFLAAIHNRLIGALIGSERGQEKQSEWKEWRQWRNRVIEREQVEQIIKRVTWTTLSAPQKIALVQCLIAPFVANEEEINALIGFGNQFHADT